MAGVRRFVVITVVAAALVAVSGGLAKSGNVATPLVLAASDVGTSYVRNAVFSRPRTLAEAGNGDSIATRRLLASKWLAGMQAGFNGVSVPWGIVSTADVFRASTLASIDRAWHRDLLRVTRGRMQRLPVNAPGRNRALVRGHLQSLETLDYMWQHGRVILSVNLTGKPDTLQLPLLMTLARRQDAKVSRRGF